MEEQRAISEWRSRTGRERWEKEGERKRKETGRHALGNGKAFK